MRPTTAHDHTITSPSREADRYRAELLAGLPVEERRVDAGGISTAVLEGGHGPTVVLLHGPGETAANWRWTIPDLAGTHRIVAPDLPAHGSSSAADLDADGAVSWLDELISQTTADPPVVVGHVLGGALAARFAARHPDRLRRLVLVDSLGLARFRPSLRFLHRFVRFAARPSEGAYVRFMDQCAFDRRQLQQRMGPQWPAFVGYNVALARAPQARAAGRLFRTVGAPRIPPDELSRIEAPTTLIWGRHDRALPLRIAQQASARYHWPLHIIDDAADDPARDQPDAFLAVLRTAIGDS